jgi:hypothetical protein
MLTSVDKAIAAALTGFLSLAAMIWTPLADHIGPDQIGALTTLLTGAVVWLVPNKAH